MQLASLKESRKKNEKTIHSLQDTIQEREMEIHTLSQQIAENDQKEKMSMELVGSKMNIIQHEVGEVHTASRLSHEEPSCYQKHITLLPSATFRLLKLEIYMHLCLECALRLVVFV